MTHLVGMNVSPQPQPELELVPTQKAYQQLDIALEMVAEASLPTEDDRLRRLEVIQHVQSAVCYSSALENVRVIPYGSFVSGVYNCNSDLDLAITGFVKWVMLDDSSQRELQVAGEPPPTRVELCKLDRRAKQMVLRKALNKLLDHQITSRETVEYVLHARVPIIKFRDLAHGIECDLSIGGDGQELKAQLFHLLSQVNPCFSPLYRVVKMWAKAHGIHDGTSGMFNSHCLALLVVFYLQNRSPPALPGLYRLFYSVQPPLDAPRPLQGSDCRTRASEAWLIAQQRAEGAQKEFQSVRVGLADLLLGFVMCMQRFFEEALLKPEQGLRLSTWWGKVLRDCAPSDYVLVVEEPMNSDDNPARTFGKRDEFPWNFHYVMDVLARTQKVLEAVHRSQLSQPLAAILWLLGPHSFFRDPTAHVLGPIAGEQHMEWLCSRLNRDHSNTGEELRAALNELQAPGNVWVPDYAVLGARQFRQQVMAEGKKKAREQHRLTSGSAPTPLTTTQIAAQARDHGPALERAITSSGSGPPTEDEGSSEAMDEMRAARSAAKLLGYEAARQVATELAMLKAVRDKKKRLKKEARQLRVSQVRAKQVVQPVAKCEAADEVTRIADQARAQEEMLASQMAAAAILGARQTRNTSAAHTGAAHTPAGHTSAGHTPAAHTSAAHTSAAHTSAGHTPAAHTSAAHTSAGHTPAGDDGTLSVEKAGRSMSQRAPRIVPPSTAKTQKHEQQQGDDTQQPMPTSSRAALSQTAHTSANDSCVQPGAQPTEDGGLSQPTGAQTQDACADGSGLRRKAGRVRKGKGRLAVLQTVAKHSDTGQPAMTGQSTAEQHVQRLPRAPRTIGSGSQGTAGTATGVHGQELRHGGQDQALGLVETNPQSRSQALPCKTPSQGSVGTRRRPRRAAQQQAGAAGSSRSSHSGSMSTVSHGLQNLDVSSV